MKDYELLEAVGGINSKYVEDSEDAGHAQKKMVLFRIPRVAAAAVAVCICLSGVTALAATGVLQGFFADVFKWDGAVIGTEYKNATEEINVNAVAEENKIAVSLEMVNLGIPPYSEIETIRVSDAKIVDASGEVVFEKLETEAVSISDGKAQILIPISDLELGDYRLIITEFEGGKKADQPLPISGIWECNFSAE